MKVQLLYPRREWDDRGAYYDTESIMKDLGLSLLFQVSSRSQEPKKGTVQRADEADRHLGEMLKKVMMIPLRTKEEIYYRQEILRDCMENKEFIGSLYEISRDMTFRWEALGKHQLDKPGSRDKSANLLSRIEILHLFINTLSRIKELCRRYDTGVAAAANRRAGDSEGVADSDGGAGAGEKAAGNRREGDGGKTAGYLSSRGLVDFCRRLEDDFGDEQEEKIRGVLSDIIFYCDGQEEYSLSGSGRKKENISRMVLDCRVAEGMKLGVISLEEVSTQERKLRKRKGEVTLREKMMTAFSKEPMLVLKDVELLEDLKQLNEQVTAHVMDSFRPMMDELRGFFEALYVQTAFYQACCNLFTRCEHSRIPLCFPDVGSREQLHFQGLMEFCMAVYRGQVPVGNDCDADGKRLLVVTGANQGGKSTFLRSIGIAQVMLQCGMPVCAKEFVSGIFPCFFTHFTRREDSGMNSGRLDEELGRIDGIIRHLGEGSMVLLNESFATTTEEEGSAIADDVIRAMVEAGVKVLTVTHLLAFAGKMYRRQLQETAFLTAQRREDGTRTFKMIPGEPELTSFGLDLYEELIGE
ncbi:MAG: hypothetical protein NC123_11550 [Butyrivibrio sp.]|nr:hypothetical protein [Acetatifactor muris]MCM1560159.1 hypothetical protein [Butyrivibrio sp.]